MSKVLTGAIGVCAQCRNKAEVKLYDGWNPEPVCEDCQRENVKLEKVNQDKGGASLLPALKPASAASAKLVDFHGTASEEREQYIAVISQADPKWVEHFIKEVMAKNVLLYDWKEIIKFERWFSILDLRRFALEVNPDFERASSKPKSIQQSLKTTRKPRKPAQQQQPVGASSQ